MNVGIDIRVLASSAHSGIQEYTEKLLEHLLPLDKNITYHLLFSSYSEHLKDYSWLHLPNVNLLKMRVPSRLLWLSSRFFGLPKFDRLLGDIDVFFSPHFLLAPLSKKTRRVSVFHDLSFERFPEFFSKRRMFWHRFQQRPYWQAKFSDLIIAVSDSTKDDIQNLYDIDPARIHRVYSGVNQGAKLPSSDEILDFKKRHHLTGEYIFSLGTLEPRKNIRGLIKAFETLKNGGRYSSMSLLIAGPRGWLYEDIQKDARMSQYRDFIHFLDAVDEEDKIMYMAGASVFVYPSFFEGFGFPPLEAMSCGVPVVASNVSSLPEVVGDAGILVNPYNNTELIRAMNEVLFDSSLRRLLIDRGFERVKSFTWHKCANDTLDIIKNTTVGRSL